MNPRNLVVETARKYIGCKETDDSHRPIIDLYNSHTPLARGYKVKYTDEWCATFVSAVLIACGMDEPAECSCSRMIALYMALGRWKEADGYIPAPGDLVMYDWQDTGKGDNKGYPDHVGIVENVSNGSITVIEGNYSGAVKRRSLAVGGKYIRGYCLPDYATKTTTEDNEMQLPTLRKGSKGDTVRAVQTLLIGYGYTCGCCGADGDFGDGTTAGLRNFQMDHRLVVDGVCGLKTWAKLLGM